MLAAGDEIGRTQRGNNNAYCQDNEISWLDWELDEHRRSLLEFVRALARLRHRHAAFRQRYFFDGRPMHEGGPKDLAWIGPDGRELPDEAWHDSQRRTLGMYIAGAAGPASDPEQASFLMILHAGWHEQEFVLPAEPYAHTYRRVLDTAAEGRFDPWPDDPAGSAITLSPVSLVALEVVA